MAVPARQQALFVGLGSSLPLWENRNHLAVEDQCQKLVDYIPRLHMEAPDLVEVPDQEALLHSHSLQKWKGLVPHCLLVTWLVPALYLLHYP